MNNKSSLILFFSRAGENWEVGNISIGNTEHLANFIHEIYGGDLHKIEPVNKYPEEYNKCTEVAKAEFNKKERPEIKNLITDIKNYEIIFIGYPIWWGTFPMPVFTQLEKLNFNGKIVMPFSTNEGSGFGNSITDLKKCCNGANIKHGLSVKGSKAKNSKNEVEKWIKKNLK